MKIQRTGLALRIAIGGLIGPLVAGMPRAGTLAALVMELVVTPLLGLWQTPMSRAASTTR